MLHQQPFNVLRAVYRAGSLSPVAVATSALDHAEQVDGKLNAFALIDRDRAIALAHQSERRWRDGSPLGLLDGMPMTIKEFAAVQGWPTRRGSVVTPDAPASSSAVFADRLLHAGAVLLGKTRAPEFNWKGVTDSPGYGITLNPLDPALTPGGSSGGCSAVVAAGVVRASIGSDAGGSVRIPAAFTGTVGLKPTFGRIPLAPPPSAFFNVVNAGPIAASVRELAEVMHVVSGPASGDWASVGLKDVDFNAIPNAANLRVGLLQADRWKTSDAIVLRGMSEFERLLTGAGFKPQTADFDVEEASRVGAFFYKMGCRAAVLSVPEGRRSELDPALIKFVQTLPSLTADVIVEMQQKRDFLAGQLHQLFDDVDVLVLPTMPILPFEAGRNTPAGSEDDDWMSWNPFTPAFNLTQTPALSYPLWPQGASMPMGVQFVAARGRDDLVLALAEWLEQRRPVRLMSS